MRLPRILLPETLTESKVIGEVTIKQHARRRMEFLWKDLNILFGLAANRQDARIVIRGAPAQGRGATVRGNQAAHANFLAGMQTNIQQILESNQGWTKKRRFAMRHSFEVLDADRDDLKKIKDVFAISRVYGASRQATHEFEAAVNIVDSGMENSLRGKVLTELQNTFTGQMEVEDAFNSIKTKIAKYFKNAFDGVPKVKTNIKRYKEIEMKLRAFDEIENALDPEYRRSLTSKELKLKKKYLRELKAVKKLLRSGSMPGSGRLKPEQFEDRLEKLSLWKEIYRQQYEGTICSALRLKRLSFREKKAMLMPHGVF